MAGVVCAVVGVTFVTAGAFWALADRVGPAWAALLIGMIYCIVAVLLVGLIARRRGGVIAPSPTAAAARDASALARGLVPILDAGPLSAACFTAGLSAGFLLQWWKRRPR